MDTVKVNTVGHLRPEICEALASFKVWEAGGWSVTRKDCTKKMGGPLTSFVAIHKAPHMFLTGRSLADRGQADSWELSAVTFHVPEVLYGYNGIQIKSQAELDFALARARAYLNELTVADVRFEEFTRMDFAYNLPCDPAEILAAPEGSESP